MSGLASSKVMLHSQPAWLRFRRSKNQLGSLKKEQNSTTLLKVGQHDERRPEPKSELEDFRIHRDDDD